jgi:hypothetical protein
MLFFCYPHTASKPSYNEKADYIFLEKLKQTWPVNVFFTPKLKLIYLCRENTDKSTRLLW